MISPAYDLLCTTFYNNDTQMALSIEGQKSGWDRKFLINAASQMFVPAKAAEAVIDKQLKVLANLPEQILNGALPYRRDQNADAASLLKKRRSALIENRQL